MKKISIISFLIIATAFNFSGCKTEAKKEENKETIKVETPKSTAPFAVVNATNDIKFTAYKTTDKVGVAGWFKKVEVLSGGEGMSVKEAININVSSILMHNLVPFIFKRS